MRDDKPALLSQVPDDPWKWLNEDMSHQVFDANFAPDWILANSVGFAQPCGGHVICAGCLRRMVKDDARRFVNEKSAAVSCQSPFAQETCRAKYDINDFNKILSRTDRDRLRNLYDEFRFPGFEIVHCPAYLRRGSRSSHHHHRTLCRCRIPVSRKVIADADEGHVIVKCIRDDG